jgi:hypothetical protein
METLLIRNLTAAGVLLLGFGCGKAPEPAPITEGSASTSAVAVATLDRGPANPTVIPPEVSDPAAMLDALTQALRNYSFSHKRIPASLSEVVTAGYIKNPPSPPAGKKFAIDPKAMRVILVSQ